ncbi:MAG: metal-dependent hydrolase [Halobacteriaceae archaeon]
MNQREHILNAALLAIGLGYVLEPAGDVATLEQIATVFIPIVLGALFPDVDAHYGRHRKAMHNLFVLAIFVAYPLYLANLYWVWLGVVTHLVLDIVGTTRGIALFYPLWSREFGAPTGVTTSSRWAPLVTVIITGMEVAALALAIQYVPVELGATALGV